MLGQTKGNPLENMKTDSAGEGLKKESGGEVKAEESKSENGLEKYQRVLKAIENLNQIRNKQKNDNKARDSKLHQVRSEMGLGEAENLGVDNDKAKNKEAEDKISQLSLELEKLEKGALGVPEDLPEGEESEMETPFIDELEQDLEAEELLEEAFAEEQKKWREEYIQSFIKDSTARALAHFESRLDDCENLEAVLEYIPIKIKAWILNETQDFIETGEGSISGFYATCKFHKHENAEGDEVKYVVGFEMGNYYGEKQTDKEKDKESLLENEERDELDKLDEDGKGETEEAK